VPTLWEATLLAFASIAMATASLFLIERPFRRMRANRFAVIGIGAISAATTALLAIWISRSEGFPNRIPQKFLAMKSFEEMWRWKCPQRSIFSTLVPVCAFGVDWDSAKIKGVLWGDSHASHFAPLLEPFARDAKASILLYDTCPAIVDGVRFSENYPNLPPTYSSACGDYRRAMLRTLDEHPEITLVILASSWVYLPGLLYRSDLKAGEHKSGIELFENALEATIADIQRPGRRIVLIGSVPQWGSNPVTCELSSAPVVRAPCTPPTLSREASDNTQQPTQRVLARVAARHPDTIAILPANPMCESGSCLLKLNGDILYIEGGHIRRNLSEDTRRILGGIIGLQQSFR
jgi:hypothetical protein